ncbi:50S ribosomal protein L17 [Candidatus Peregrinibacteria bacterium CG_4_9_14_0_2_um_filter_53_11]|nr:MAG: 50S ribosomal protein L17 [Candidatus Peregrinibacteria bacterium CG_4_9_14_0_2_um_filter_53_11]
MRHQNRLKTLGLPSPHRESLLRNLTASLIIHEKIRTTKSRAKALSQRFDRVMSLIQRKDDREAIRTLGQYLTIKEASKKILKELKPRYADRTSGFTRITGIGLRAGDSATLVQIELV